MKIDHIAGSLLKLQIKIGVHLINAELSQLLILQVAIEKRLIFGASQTNIRSFLFCQDFRNQSSFVLQTDQKLGLQSQE